MEFCEPPDFIKGWLHPVCASGIQAVLEIQEEYGHRDMLVHMRIATHGSVCLENNHPFHIDTQTVFAHNGIMPHEFHPPAKSDLSDTRYFNKVFLQSLNLII